MLSLCHYQKNYLLNLSVKEVAEKKSEGQREEEMNGQWMGEREKQIERERERKGEKLKFVHVLA